MILYHGSKNKFDVLERRQAQKGKNVAEFVPEEELSNAIYLSSDYAFALAISSLPEGFTDIDNDTRTIKSEFPQNFNPEEKVYVYKIDSDKIPKDKIKFLDDGIQAVVDLDSIPFESREEHLAKEILEYYKLAGLNREISSELKMR